MDIFVFIITILSLLPFLILKLTGKFIYFELTGLLAIIVHGVYLFGPNILLFLLLIYVVSTVAELVSLKTSFNLFGVTYSYNLKHPIFSSGVNIMGVYPIEVSYMWVIFKYISFNVGLIILEAFSISYSWLLLLVPLILISIDFIIDPVAVNVHKMWSWQKGSRYFGIPYRNFVGWFFVGLLSSVIYNLLVQTREIKFNILLITPVIFYAYNLLNTRHIININKHKTILGMFPLFTWTILSFIGLIILFLKK